MIYADNAATTRLSPKALEAMLPYLQGQYGNPSGVYSFGAQAKRAIDLARKQAASALRVAPEEIVFTSGGTEGNNWALSCAQSGHILTARTEHPSVLQACAALEKKGVAVTYLSVDRQGRVRVSDVLSAIRPDTKLVSIHLGNNELGTLQPIAEIARALSGSGILFHTDAVQAVGHIPVDAKALGVDLLSASAHKFHGAKGTGFLYIRAGTPWQAMLHGGKQENRLRAGTENVAGIVAAGAALEESVAALAETQARQWQLAQWTWRALEERIPGIALNTPIHQTLPGFVNITFGNVSGEALLHQLDLKGICVSVGSACAAGQNTPSHVLKAIGLTDSQALSALRITYGRYNTQAEAACIVEALCAAYQRII